MTGRILIVDPVATNRIVLRVKLTGAFYEVSQAASGQAALDALAAAQHDLVIASDVLPDLTGAELCRQIKASESHADMPVVLLSCRDCGPERLAGLMAGADDILSRQVDDLVLLARLRSLLRARNAESEMRLRDDTQRALGLAEHGAAFLHPAQVTLVAAGPGHDMAATLAALRRTLPDHITVVKPEMVLRNDAAPAEVFLIAEALGPDAKGLALLTELRARAPTRHSAILYVAGAHQRREAAAALDLGASDLMIGPLDPPELALRLQKQIARKRTSDRLRANVRDGLRAALTDPLTGVYNRRYALPHLARMAERSVQKNLPFAVMLADLDHFKTINDRFGHAAGDAVLTGVAQRLADNLRAADLLARFGGEEFLIVMPDVDKSQSQATASRLCKLIAQTPFALPDGQTLLDVTISIGVCVGGVGTADIAPGRLIEMADRALYCAKADGRNQALVDSGADTPA